MKLLLRFSSASQRKIFYNFEKFSDILFIYFLDAKFYPWYLTRLYTDCFGTFRSDNMLRVTNFTFSIRFLIVPLEVKFNVFFCWMGLCGDVQEAYGQIQLKWHGHTSCSVLHNRTLQNSHSHISPFKY